MNSKGRENIKTHSMYHMYNGMRVRGTKPLKKERKYYKGIKICERWKNNFWHFLEDMGERPTPFHTIDRIDNTKGYYKENCRWVTRAEQNKNKRNSNRCKYGHPWKAKTTMHVNNGRRCRICFNAYQRAYYNNKKRRKNESLLEW